MVVGTDDQVQEELSMLYPLKRMITLEVVVEGVAVEVVVVDVEVEEVVEGVAVTVVAEGEAVAVVIEETILKSTARGYLTQSKTMFLSLGLFNQ